MYAFIFPGQGSQNVGMGKEIYENSPKAKELLEEASDFCKIDFKHLLFSQNEDLNKSEFTQPAIVLNSLMCYCALLEKKPDLKPKFALGHSLGEFSALAISKALNFLETIKLVHKRGKFMQEDCRGIEVAMMVILGLKDEVVEELCIQARNNQKKIYAANYNCDGQIVVAGLKSDLLGLENDFKDKGAKRTMLLNMNVISHCPLLENASLKLSAELEKILNPTFAPVISNVNAKIYHNKNEAMSLLRDQLIKPVLYKQSIKNIENEIEGFIEFGASVLKGLNKKITSKNTWSLTNLKELDSFLKENE